VARALQSIDAGNDAHLRALLAPIESKLRKEAATVSGLDHAHFVGSVRVALRLTIEQVDCPGKSARCKRSLASARAALDDGDHLHDRGDDRRAVMRWRQGLQTLERISGQGHGAGRGRGRAHGRG
jgi:hypothetical protein